MDKRTKSACHSFSFCRLFTRESLGQDFAHLELYRCYKRNSNFIENVQDENIAFNKNKHYEYVVHLGKASKNHVRRVLGKATRLQLENHVK